MSATLGNGERTNRRYSLLGGLLRWTGLVCLPGGALWALSPFGVYLSELKYRTPDVFWKLFPSAPLLLLIGLVGLHLRVAGRSGRAERVAFALSLLGLLLILAGAVGQFWLHSDDVYIMTAPAYRAFRLGLYVLAAGSILFGVAAARDETLPAWAALPLAIGGLCGLVAFVQDLGSFGAVLWMLFGAGWAWVGLTLLLEGLLRISRRVLSRS